MRFLEGLIFTSLAAGAHLSLWAVSPTFSGASGSDGGGNGPITIATASVEHTALAAAWQRPPVAEQTLAAAMDAPAAEDAARVAVDSISPAIPVPTALPLLVAPMPTPQAPTVPQIDTTSAAPPAPTVTRPKARPTPPPTLARATPAAPAQTEKAAGGGVRRAPADRADTSTLNAADVARSDALRAQWGAAIYAKVRRNMRYPANARATGTASLALQIASNGSLQNLRLTRSSGSAVLDRAALRAVSQAGRFDRAPKGLTGDVHRFSLSLTFTQ